MDCWSQRSQNGNHLMGLCDHTGPHLVPAKFTATFYTKYQRITRKLWDVVVPLQREKGTSLSFYFPHIWNKIKWERKHKSIQLSQNMTAWLTSATWQGYLHPVKAGDLCAIDTAQWQLLNHDSLFIIQFPEDPCPSWHHDMGVTIKSGLFLGINNT